MPAHSQRPRADDPSSARSVAVIVDGPLTPAWQKLVIETLDASQLVEVAEVRLLDVAPRPPARRLHDATERHLFNIAMNPLDPVPVAARSTDSPSIDLVIWLSRSRPPATHPHPLLFLAHDGIVESIDDAFVRAVLKDAGCVETEVLLRRGEQTITVDRTVSGVRAFSATVSSAFAHWKLAATIPRAVERLPGIDHPAELRDHARTPSPWALIRRAAPRWVRVLLTRLMFRRPWMIAVRRRARSVTDGWREEGLVDWGNARMYADPFLFEHEGAHHLFCEEVPADGKMGVISHTELHRDGTPADPPVSVLRAEHHLSYPFVFAHEGDVFMIPETSAIRRIELYRATDFPRGWTLEATLIEDVDASDATLLVHEGRFWLFAACRHPGASSLDELSVFWADALHGPWRPHAGNPVVSDVRGSRPAGAVQLWGSRLIRPAQDGSRRYGSAVSFREIDVLSTTTYAEHEIARLEPRHLRSARATHTYTADSVFEATDFRRRTPRMRRGALRP